MFLLRPSYAHVDYGDGKPQPRNHPYHYPKFSEFHDPVAFREALKAEPKFSDVKTQYDYDNDPVCFWFESSNVVTARNFVVSLLGINHGLMIFEGGSERAGRKEDLQQLRRQRAAQRRL